MKTRSATKLAVLLIMVMLTSVWSFAATVSSRSLRLSKTRSVSESPRTKSRIAKTRKSRRARVTAKKKRSARSRRVRSSRKRYYERFTMPSWANDITSGDITAGEDPIVRRAAIEALGNMNGTAVAVDPSNGRILAMVNQRLALSGGATPCSTIKVPVAMAALSEGIIDKDTPVALGRRWKMNLTDAMAASNNAYFEVLGRRMGFDRYSYYAHQFGLGELAGWNIPGETLGTFPSQPLPAKAGGVGKMCSFGEGIKMTPLQLAALTSAISNGGTLYYLQHPQSSEEAASFQPRVKRHLQIKHLLGDLEPGMASAVTRGTARSLRYSFSDETVLGKTGTCSNNSGTRYGWFVSYANTQYGRIVVVFFLQGGRATYGPKAAELAGKFYRNLGDSNYFANRTVTPARTAETMVGAGE